MTSHAMDRTVLIVGAPSGLQRAAAKGFLATGARVIEAHDGSTPADVSRYVEDSTEVDVLFVTDARLVPFWAGELAPRLAARNGAIVAAVTVRALAGDITGRAEAAHGGAAIASMSSIATEFGGAGLRANCVTVLPHDVPPEVLERHTLVDVPTPDDVVQAVLFLASDDAAFVTGQVLHCDGGFLAHLPHFAMLREAGVATVGDVTRH